MSIDGCEEGQGPGGGIRELFPLGRDGPPENQSKRIVEHNGGMIAGDILIIHLMPFIFRFISHALSMELTSRAPPNCHQKKDNRYRTVIIK